MAQNVASKWITKLIHKKRPVKKNHKLPHMKNLADKGTKRA